MVNYSANILESSHYQIVSGVPLSRSVAEARTDAGHSDSRLISVLTPTVF